MLTAGTLIPFLRHFSYFQNYICSFVIIPTKPFSEMPCSLRCERLVNTDEGNAFLKIREPSFVCIQYSCVSVATLRSVEF